MIRDDLSQVPDAEFTTRPIREVLRGSIYPEEYVNSLINALLVEVQGAILSDHLNQK